MSTWAVTVSDPLNETVLTTFENGARVSDGAIALRKFDPPTVVPPGTSKNLNLYARQDLAQIPPRAIIQFSLDGQPVFWGPAIIVPPLSSPGAGPADRDRDSKERVTVAGGEQLLKESIIGPRLFEVETDVAAIAHELCALYAHRALTVDEDNFPATGAVLTVFYRPTATLHACLEVLAETVPGGASYWVDAAGAVHFAADGGG